MRQIDTFVRLRGNRGSEMAVGRLAVLNWAWNKTVQAVPVRRFSLPLRSHGSDPGSVFGLLPPGADAAKAVITTEGW